MSACTGGCVASERDFERDYELGRSPVMRAIEQRVLGVAYGATSWTTLEQADHIATRLDLAPGVRLLEVGAGSGWPALHFSLRNGCDAVLCDATRSGMHAARERAEADGIGARCFALVADGTALPFPARAFDRLHHADVLCCTPHKRELLLECRRVATPGARMAFTVIALAADPDAAGRRLLEQSGPPYPDAGADYEPVLRECGWALRERSDVTAAFARCIDRLLAETEARRDALRALLGDAEFETRLQRRRSTRDAIARGLLEREIFVAAAS